LQKPSFCRQSVQFRNTFITLQLLFHTIEMQNACQTNEKPNRGDLLVETVATFRL